MNEHIIEMTKDLSEAALAIAVRCVIATTRHKLKSKKSKRWKR